MLLQIIVIYFSQILKKEMKKNTLASQIGKRLRVARKAAGFKTAKSFALKYGIAAVTYSQHETGKRSLGIDVLIKYCNILNVKSNWLISGKGCPFFKNGKFTEEVLKDELKYQIYDYGNDIIEEFEILKKPVALVDVIILGKIVENLLDVFSEKPAPIPHDEVIDFIIEVYNDVIKITGDYAEKSRIIKLSLLSLKKNYESKGDTSESTNKIFVQ